MIKRKEIGFMANEDQKEPLPKGQTEAVNKPEQPETRNLSIEEVLGQYPVDRDRARDVVFLEISKNLFSIANSLKAIPEALLLLGKKIEDAKKE
jgi:hypothetical protein